MKTGRLFVVATPIGNLSDITLRALEVLKNVSYILSEDTRETHKLLEKYEISASQISYRDQNHTKVLPKIIQILNTGSDVALVSDSGTPLISDPGFKLISELLDQGYNVESIPGPSALISALVSSGLPTDKFSFVGFLPRSSGQIVKILTSYGNSDSTLIIYESPFRVEKLLNYIKDTLGDRQVVLAKELTKIHEKFYRGTTSEVLDEIKGKKHKGEFVVLVAKEGFK
ncbi:16S rRNA (cytidine(1402)-2'-O)-methyltransferase [Patescibacteria group bacterium]